MAAHHSLDASHATGLPPALLQGPVRVVTVQSAAAVYAHPRAELSRLAARGVLQRLHAGVYAVVPPGRTAESWRPTIEAAAGALGTALVGHDHAVLMGISAARLHGAVPRAIAIATVAVPAQRRPVTLDGRSERVIFIPRDVERLDAELMDTDLGPLLVTGIEQTVLDLAHRPDRDGVGDEVRAAVALLMDRADPAVLTELAERQRLRAALARATAWTAPDR
jgi:predicted transcriptional regulator of viral defense system